MQVNRLRLRLTRQAEACRWKVTFLEGSHKWTRRNTSLRGRSGDGEVFFGGGVDKIGRIETVERGRTTNNKFPSSHSKLKLEERL